MPVNITDADVFTEPVVAPADGDSANGTTFQAAPQALANRTRNLKNRIDGLPSDPAFLSEDFEWSGEHTFNDVVVFEGAVAFTDTLGIYQDLLIGGTTNEVIYGTSLGVPAPRTRTVVVPLAGGLGPAAQGVYSQLTGVVTFSGLGSRAYALRLPRGAVTIDFIAGFRNDSGGSSSLTLDLVRIAPNFSTGAVPTVTTLATGTTGSLANGVEGIVTVAHAATIDNSLYEYTLVVSTTGGALTGLRARFADPGPRNG